jgi:excinuclease UvrABC helicase subunit UvrB
LQQRLTRQALAEQASWLRELPIAWMKKQGWIQQLDHAHHEGEQVEACLRYYGVASVETWQSEYAAPLAAFRGSDKLEKQMYEHARNLEFEEAALLRDRLEEIKQLTLGPAA